MCNAGPEQHFPVGGVSSCSGQKSLLLQLSFLVVVGSVCANIPNQNIRGLTFDLLSKVSSHHVQTTHWLSGLTNPALFPSLAFTLVSLPP